MSEHEREHELYFFQPYDRCVENYIACNTLICDALKVKDNQLPISKLIEDALYMNPEDLEVVQSHLEAAGI